MEKEKLEGLLIDYIDNNINAVDRHMIEQELLQNADVRKLYQELKEVIHLMEQSAPLLPSPMLKKNFDKVLNEEIAASNRSRMLFFRPSFYRVAAAVALMIL